MNRFRCHLALPLVVLMLMAACGTPQTDEPADASTGQVPERANDGLAGPDTSETDDDLPVAAPAIDVATLDGSRFTLSERRGEVVLVNFWATWCGPCIVEIPDLQELHDTYHDRGFTVVGVSVEDGEEELVRSFVDEYQMTYPVAISSDVADAFGGVYGLPTSFLIDRKGQVVERVIGLFPTEEMLPRIEALLGDESV